MQVYNVFFFFFLFIFSRFTMDNIGQFFFLRFCYKFKGEIYEVINILHPHYSSSYFLLWTTFFIFFKNLL
jgi:hypothetical protein